MTFRPLLAAASLAALAACGAQEDAVPEPGTTEGDEAGPELTGFASTYSEIDLEACKQTSLETEEGTSATWTCDGFGDIPLFIAEGDGRFDLDAGVENEQFETIGAFNSLAETVEWRLKDGEPFAVIFRYNDATVEAEGRTVLAVEKIGRADSPGCRVAQIAGETPDANQVARDLADQSVADFSCGVDEAAVVGDAL